MKDDIKIIDLKSQLLKGYFSRRSRLYVFREIAGGQAEHPMYYEATYSYKATNTISKTLIEVVNV